MCCSAVHCRQQYSAVTAAVIPRKFSGKVHRKEVIFVSVLIKLSLVEAKIVKLFRKKSIDAGAAPKKKKKITMNSSIYEKKPELK